MDWKLNFNGEILWRPIFQFGIILKQAITKKNVVKMWSFPKLKNFATADTLLTKKHEI